MVQERPKRKPATKKYEGVSNKDIEHNIVNARGGREMDVKTDCMKEQKEGGHKGEGRRAAVINAENGKG